MARATGLGPTGWVLLPVVLARSRRGPSDPHRAVRARALARPLDLHHAIHARSPPQPMDPHPAAREHPHVRVAFQPLDQDLRLGSRGRSGERSDRGIVKRSWPSVSISPSTWRRRGEALRTSRAISTARFQSCAACPSRAEWVGLSPLNAWARATFACPADWWGPRRLGLLPPPARACVCAPLPGARWTAPGPFPVSHRRFSV